MCYVIKLTSGPPLSPLQAETPPVIGPVQRFVTSKGLSAPKAASHSAKERTGKTAFWRMFGIVGKVPDAVAPHPDKREDPVGIRAACGKRTGRILAV